MKGSTKAATFPAAGQAKSPPTSQTVPPSTCKRNAAPNFIPLNRAWSTPSTPNSFLNRPERQNVEDVKMSACADAQYLSPMERWEKEDLRQSQWNNIESFDASLKQFDHVSSQNVQSHENNSSMTGNVGSKK